MWPFRLLAPRRYCALNRLAHNPPMHTQLPRHALDRAYPELVLQPNLLEQLHLGSPVELQPPEPSSPLKSRVEVCSVQGWAKTNRQSGPL